MKLVKFAVVALAAAFPLGTALASSGKDLLAAAAETGRAGKFLEAVQAAGLADKLKGAEPYTLFIPSDEAFARLGSEMQQELFDPANKDELAAVLKSHMVPGRVTVGTLAGQPASFETAASTDITIKADKELRAANAKVVLSDVIASNGVIHVVDEIIEPVL